MVLSRAPEGRALVRETRRILSRAHRAVQLCVDTLQTTTPRNHSTTVTWRLLRYGSPTLCLNLASYPIWLVGFENDLYYKQL